MIKALLLQMQGKSNTDMETFLPLPIYYPHSKKGERKSAWIKQLGEYFIAIPLGTNFSVYFTATSSTYASTCTGDVWFH